MFQQKNVTEVINKSVIVNRYTKKGIEELIRKDAEAQGFKITKLEWGASVKDYSGKGLWGEITTLSIKAQAKELPKKSDHRAATDGGKSLIHIADPTSADDKKTKSNKSKSKKK